jgi:hypothetical protein
MATPANRSAIDLRLRLAYSELLVKASIAFTLTRLGHRFSLSVWGCAVSIS